MGHLGKIHMNCLRSIDHFEVVGFYDPDTELSDTVAEERGLTAFKSYEHLLQKVDAVDIVAPTSEHFVLAKQAIEARKHVFVEKPLTRTVEEAQTLLKLRSGTNLVVQVGHVERFNPAMLAIRDREMDPKFIEVHRLANFNPRGTDVSVVLDLMIHDLDIILKLVPSKVKSVLANGVCLVSNTPDIGNARIEWENGCVANVTASRMSFKNMRKMRIFQSDAYIGLDFLERQAQVISLSDDLVVEEGADTAFELDTPNGRKTIKIEMPEAKPVNAIEMELSCFAESILNGSSPEVGIEEGLEALKLAKVISDKIDVNLDRVLV